MKKVHYGRVWCNQHIKRLCAQTKVLGQGIWQAIKGLVQEQQQQAPKVFLQHLKLIVGNGAKIRFWEDHWTQNRSLMKLFPSLYRLSSQQNALIINMDWFEGTLWKWTLAWIRELSQDESQQLNELVALLCQHYLLQDQEDTVIWKGQKRYSVKELNSKECEYGCRD